MRLGFSTDGKNLIDSKIIETPQNFDQAMTVFKDTMTVLAKQNKIKACAGGLPGPLDPQKAQLLNAPNLKDWVNKPIKQALEKIVGCPVHLENDAALIGVGEAIAGAGLGKKIVAYITVSTGVGGARIVNGQVDTTSIGFEPGHQIIVLWGDKAYELESLISGTGLAARYQKPPETLSEAKIWDEAAYELAVGLNNVAVFWSPEVIVLGGSIMSRISLAKVQENFKKLLKIYPKAPEVVLAKLGEQAGLIGGLYLLNPTPQLLIPT